jgi:hypothetical protein
MVCFIQGTSSALCAPSLLCGEGMGLRAPKVQKFGDPTTSLLHAVEKVPNGRMRSFT